MSLSTPPGSNQPYIGPRPFSEDERDRFFGRTREAKDLLSLVLAERLVLFYAQSGAGKSSLINTCLLPDLRREGFNVLQSIGRVAAAHRPTGAEPAATPTANIFVANLLHSLAPPSNPAPATETTLGVALATHWADHMGPADPLAPRMLIIDQFEELWTTGGEHWAARADFFSQLGEALISDPQLWVLLVMREDYIARLDPYAHLLPGKLRTRYYMQRMNHAAALPAIREPAARYGRPFAADAAATLADQLHQTASIDAALYVDEFIEPVQLQVVCKQIWEKLQPTPGDTITLTDLTQLAGAGGMAQFITGALADYYEASLAIVLRDPTCMVTERDLRHWFDTQVIIEGGRRNLVPRGVSATGGLPNTALHHLEQRYLLHTVERGSSGAWIELAHDRMVEPIQQANRSWFAQHPLIQAAAAWAAAGRDPARLYTTQQLAQAEPDFAANQSVYGELEREFLAASNAHESVRRQAEQEQENVRQREVELKLAQQRAADQAYTAVLLRRGSAALAALLLLALITAGWAFRQQSLALEARGTAVAAQVETDVVNQALRAKGLAAEARILVTQMPQRALLLTLEALAVHRSRGEPYLISAEQSLRDRLGEIGGEPLVSYHTAVQTVAFSPDGNWLARADVDKQADVPTDATVRLWNQQDPTAVPVVLAGQASSVYTLAFDRAGRLASAGDDGKIRLWEVANPSAEPVVLAQHDGAINAVTFAPDGRLASAGADGKIRLWNLPALTTTAVLTAPALVVNNDIVFLAGTQLLASADDDTKVRLWDLQTLTVTAVLTDHTANVRAVAASQDGKWLASGGDDNLVLLWNLAVRAVEPRRLTGHAAAILDLAFSPDGRWLVSASADGTMRRWDVNDQDGASVVLAGHEDWVNAIAFHPAGDRLVSASDDQTLRRWRIDAPQTEPRVLRHYSGPVRTLTYDPNGQWLASAGDDTAIRLWSVATGELHTLVGHTATVRSLVFTPNGAQLVSAGDDQSVRIWDLQTVTATAVLTGHRDAVIALTANADGSRIASASNGSEQRVFLWDAVNGRLLRQWTADPPANFLTLAFTSNDDIVATGDDSLVYTWSGENGALLSRNVAPQASSADDTEVTAQAVSPVNGWQARVGVDYTIQLQSPLAQQNESDSGPLLLRGHEGQVNALVFSPDGRWLASGGDDSTVRLWTVEIEDLIKLACRTAGRNLTSAEWESEPPPKSCPELP